MELHLPDMKDRREDIPPMLFDYFARKASIQFERDYSELDEQELALLIDHDWPGNVRQLKNVAERYVLAMSSFQLYSCHLGHESSRT